MHREISLMLCDHLEGWEGRREGEREGGREERREGATEEGREGGRK